MAAIEPEHQRRLNRHAARLRANPLALAGGLAPDVDELYGINEATAGCIVCHK